MNVVFFVSYIRLFLDDNLIRSVIRVNRITDLKITIMTLNITFSFTANFLRYSMKFNEFYNYVINIVIIIYNSA